MGTLEKASTENGKGLRKSLWARFYYLLLFAVVLALFVALAATSFRNCSSCPFSTSFTHW
jgi:hypothetical protein